MIALATVVAVLCILNMHVLAYPNFNKYIPNGDKVTYDGESWPAVGHVKVFGGGDLNAFGKDFMRAGNKWTEDLCKHDSDGDGRSNGEELGDPKCLWQLGNPMPKTRFVTHPGIPDECPSPAPSPAIMKIAVIGSGSVGRALHDTFKDAGINVGFGVRNKDTHTGDGNLMNVTEAAQWATVIVLAVPANVILEVAKEISDSARNKIVIDCSNPIKWDKGPVWTPPASGSMTAELVLTLPESKLVKAFNTFGAEHMKDTGLSGVTTQVFMAGDDASAKKTVSQICQKSRFLPIDAGPLRNAGVLENMAILWIHLATVGGKGREFIISTVPQ